jgi:hypothetical protein
LRGRLRRCIRRRDGDDDDGNAGDGEADGEADGDGDGGTGGDEPLAVVAGPAAIASVWLSPSASFTGYFASS